VDVFGIGPLELLLILIVVMIFVGPDRLPKIANKLGRSVKDMRAATREFSREIDAARQTVEGPINELKAPIQEVAEPFQEMKKSAESLTQATKGAKDPAKALRESVMRELNWKEQAEPQPGVQPEPKIAPPQAPDAAASASTAPQPEAAPVSATPAAANSPTDDRSEARA
jgi:sec-independent protein translocase protein TatB